jgi:HK97 family phage major capsid protein
MINAPSVNRQTTTRLPRWTPRRHNGVRHMADQKTTLQARQAVQMQKAKLILDTAEREARGLTADENKELKALEAAVDGMTTRLSQMDGDDSMNAEIARLTDGMTPAAGAAGAGNGGGRRAAGKGSLGEQFLASETFKWLKSNRASLPSGAAWSSPSSELFAATLTEDAASGGDLVVPHFLPGILALPTRPLTMADLIAPGTTDSNLVTYMKETTFTNAADSVAEGAAKPESTLIFDAVSDPVRKIAHWVPVTEEMLEDVSGIRSYIDTRLRQGVDLALDDMLINGSVVAPDIIGFLARVGLGASIARVAEANADTVLSQIIALWTATNIQPDGIVMNPAQWKTILQTKDTTGQYYGGGPFASPHAPTLWGVPVALTSAIVAGTALVGAFKTAAQLFRKGGMRVEASNAHSDFFVKNLVAIRAELRAALAVYRPSAFATVTNLN